MENAGALALATVWWTWQIGIWVSFVVLIREAHANLAIWKWVVLLPCDLFLSTIWPIYWFILRPLMG